MGYDPEETPGDRKGHTHRRPLSPEDRAAAETKYSEMLAYVFETIVGPTLEREHPEWGQVLYKTVLMPRIENLELDVSAVGVPRLNGSGKVMHAFEWDELDTMGPVELGAELVQRVRSSLLKGE